MALWTIQLCDLNGSPLQNITGIASDRQLTFRLNRPASMTFKVPSWDTQIATANPGDGLPYLCELARTVKAFRLEVQPDGTSKFVPRFCGVIYQLEDDGDTDASYTQVTCFDPLQKLQSRLVYDSAIAVSAKNASVPFVSTDVVQIAKTIVDRSVSVKGRHGVSTDTSLGARFDAGTAYSITWERKPVAEALTDLTVAAGGGFDLILKPLDRTDGILVAMQCYTPKKGVVTNTKFGWAVGVQNLKQLQRQKDGTKLANSIVAVGNTAAGGDQIVANVVDAPSIALYDVYEDVISYDDVVDGTQLTNLAAGDLTTRKRADELIQLTPQPDMAPPPWVDSFGSYTYELGDYVQVTAGAAYRGGYDGSIRVFGFDLTVTDEAQEQVTAIYTAADS